jgi:hypothetical protein
MHCFIEEVVTSITTDFYDSYAIAGIWRKKDHRNEIKKELSGVMKIKEYIMRSYENMKSVEEKINTLLETREEVAVWGVGSLTSRLLANTNLGKANIKFFVDSNSSLHGNKIKGIEIARPESLMGKSLTVFVSSHVYGNEIKRILMDNFHYGGRIIVI